MYVEGREPSERARSYHTARRPGPRLHERPGIAVAAPVLGEAAVVGERLRADEKSLLLVGGEEIGERSREPALHEALQIVHHLLGKRLPRIVPDDGAELELGVEAEPVAGPVGQVWR